MAKKKAAKRVPLKVATKHKRNTKAKSILFVKGKKDPEKVIKSLDAFDWNKFNYLRMKNKPDGHHHKPPQGITVILGFKKGKKTYHTSEQSPYDFVVNKQSVKDFTKQVYKDHVQNFDTMKFAAGEDTNLEDMEDTEEDDEPEGVTISKKYLNKMNPAFITDITIRFFYGKS